MEEGENPPPPPNPRVKMTPDPVRHPVGVEFLPFKPLTPPKRVNFGLTIKFCPKH